MIKEITAQSGGAVIKILTDKEKEKEMSETVVSIGGTLTTKIQAAAIIARRITEFKQDAKACSPLTLRIRRAKSGKDGKIHKSPHRIHKRA